MKKHFFRIIRCLCISYFLFAGQQLMAQPFNLDDNIKPVELNFTEYKKDGEDKAKGRISLNTLSQEVDTMYYFIKGLSMYSPTYFSLNSADPDADIKINLCKENWHSFHKTGEVKGKNIWKENFKTEGDFGIMVIARKKPVRYVLLVWTGEEMKVDMPSVFKPASNKDVSGGAGWIKKNGTLLLIVAVALIIILFLLFKLKTKKK